MLNPEKSSTPSEEQNRQLWRRELDEHRRALDAMTGTLEDAFCRAVGCLESAVRAGGKLLLFGNGGSASDAQHIAAELVVRYSNDRPAIAAIALCTDTSTLTACANDLGYDAVFSRQIEAVGRAGDVAIAISTSGKSKNVINALRRARAMEIATVGMSGGAGGEFRALCDEVLIVPSTVTARIQEMHITVGHMLCKALEERLCLVR